MKKHVAILVIALVSGLFAQNFTTVKDFPGQSKDILCSQTLRWIAKTFNSANSVIQFQDAGQVVCKAIGDIPLCGICKPGHFNYTLEIDFKDGKVKTDFSGYQNGSLMRDDTFKQYAGKAEDYFKHLNESLFANLETAKAKDNW
jgi:hypothetical protein